MRIVWRIATLATLAAVLAGCQSQPSGGISTSTEVLAVPRPDGTTEPVWIEVARPEGPGPFPVVVYGHGQGTGNFLNCTPDRVPDDGDAIDSARIVEDLAALGYEAIAVLYRNRGDGVPAIGTLRPRDHLVLDARAFLAAAHWAHDRDAGDSRVALIGVSMGSFPATWATAPLPQLADLQAGLDIVTSIPTAMLGNHIANTGRSAELLGDADPATRAGAIALAAFSAVTVQLARAEQPELTAADLDAVDAPLTRGLTAPGVELFHRMFVDAPDPALAGCGDLDAVAAACDSTCATSTFAAVAAAHGLATVDPADWLTQDTLDAIAYWSPPDAVDPSAATTNPMLAAQRAMSPAYALSGPLLAPRMLPLVSIGDHVITGQVEGGNQAAELYLARLRSTGVAIPDPVPAVMDATCDHGNYLDPVRPQCGWDLVVAELTAAFAPP